jgi:hypothetical protein
MNQRKRKKYDTDLQRVVDRIKKRADWREGEDYSQRDHIHCMDQEDPACGLDKHTQCCLCRKQVE